MAIHFISGKPGGGKSLYATKLCFEELRFGTRHIVTNLALNIGELNAYYQEHYDTDSGLVRYRVPWFLGWLWWILPDWLAFEVTPISMCQAETRIKQPRMDDICSRVTVISDEDLPTFFTKRPGCNIESIPNDQWKKGVRPDYTVVKDAGILFCLDEIHIAFNSRAWADTGAEVLYYLSQHRKLGDDVLAITQSVANVDKQFRSVAQDFTYIRNLGKERLGKFRLPARFVRKTYAQPATDTSEPMDIGFFSLDINGIARCYDTAKGVGIHGRAGADTKERKKGLHWAWFAIGLPVLLFCIVKYLPTMLVRHLNHVQSPAAAEKQPVVPGPSRENQNPPATRPNEKQPVSENPAVAELEVTNRNQFTLTNVPVTCVGWSIDGHGRVFVFTSDGETYSSQYGEVDWIRHREVSCLGHTYQLKTRQPKSLPDPAIKLTADEPFHLPIKSGISAPAAQ